MYDPLRIPQEAPPPVRTRYANATVVDVNGSRRADVFVEGGRFTDPGPCEETVDCAGLTLAPALIDTHCHLRDPGWPQKETMESGMRAALHGGYGTLCAMANTDPVCETPERVEANLQKAASLRLCRLIQAGAAGVGLEDTTPTDRAALSRVTRVLSNDGKTIFSDDFMRQLLLDSTRYGFVISTHCQPERAIVARDIALLREVGGNLHVGHISRAETLAMIRAAKAEGLTLTCEVTPHHLFGYDCDYRVNPPLRTRADVEALIGGVRDGTIDCLATDHAPHTPADKAAGMAGISNIDYALQVFLRVFDENDIPLARLFAMASYNPARVLGVEGGLIAPGCSADMIALDTTAETRVEAATLLSRSRNTPFDGRAVRGRVLWTMMEGEIRYDHGQAL